jgi:hypothetical protein
MLALELEFFDAAAALSNLTITFDQLTAALAKQPDLAELTVPRL